MLGTLLQTAEPVATPAPVPLGGRIVTVVLVAAPLLGLACLLPFMSGHLLNISDVVIATVLYVITGFGISVGFHRLLTHRSFKAKRALKIGLTVAGSMAIEGSAISWVAIHRRHHMFSDQLEDPHSPHRYGPGAVGTLKGFLWAHVGWLFAMDPTDTGRFAPDLRRDRDFVVIDRLFPLLAVASLTLPFFIGWALSGTLFGALERASLGWSRQDGDPPSRHVEHQLGLPPLGAKAVRNPRPEHQCRRAIPPLLRGELAQLPPRRAILGAPRRAAAPA